MRWKIQHVGRAAGFNNPGLPFSDPNLQRRVYNTTFTFSTQRKCVTQIVYVQPIKK